MPSGPVSERNACPPEIRRFTTLESLCLVQDAQLVDQHVTNVLLFFVSRVSTAYLRMMPSHLELSLRWVRSPRLTGSCGKQRGKPT